MKNIMRLTWFIPLLILVFTGCNPANQGATPPNQGLLQNQAAEPYDATDLRRMQNDPFTSVDQTVPLADRMRGQNVEMNELNQQRNLSQRRGTALDNQDIHHGQTEGTRQRNLRGTQRGNVGGLGQGIKAPQAPNRNQRAQEVAERLVKIATRIEQVNDATAVVVGRWAVVGIDVDAKLDRAKVGTIKYTVAEALKADPKGAYAIVTADIDTNYRLRQMANDIRGGKPIEGVMDELAAIIGRIMPQVPRDIEALETRPNNQRDNNTQR